MKSIEVTFKVNTPMFMGGNDHKGEFRIPSLLGVLRFWYRATAPRHLIHDISALREAEARLFGSTNTGQAAFLVRADANEISFADASTHITKSTYGINYLGYGPISFKGVQRSCIKEGSTIKIKFIFRPNTSNQQPDKDGLIRAIKAFTLFGGLGSRSRRGFGSVTLLTFKDEAGNSLWRAPQNRNELHSEIKSFINALELRDITEVPPYTAFSYMSRIIISQTNSNPFSVLESIGQEMIRYRSYGRSDHGGSHNWPWGEKAKPNFANDHDLLLNLDKNTGLHPRRVAFGLPHNYHFGSIKKNFNISGETSERERRASPLFIHIHALGKEYAAVLTFLPAKFLPDNEKIKMTGNGSTVYVPCDVDWQVITDFLASIPDRMEVL